MYNWKNWVKGHISRTQYAFQIIVFDSSQWNLTDLSQILMYYICAGLVRVLAGKESVHVVVLRWSSWKPISWSYAYKFYRYGHCCDSLHKVYHSRRSSKSLTGRKQGQTNTQSCQSTRTFQRANMLGSSLLPVGSCTGHLVHIGDIHIKHSVSQEGKILQNDCPDEDAFLQLESISQWIIRD